MSETARPAATELRSLSADLIRMGGLAEAQVVDAVEAVVRRDVALAQALIVRDLRLDALQVDVERRALALISRQDLADDQLRVAVCALKLAGALERCGDLARNIAKRSLILSAAEPATGLMGAVERMGRLVAARLHEVLDALAAGEIAGALDVWRRDGEVDEHHESLFAELLAFMSREPAQVTTGAHLLFVTKNLERIGDYATNIAEVLHFQLTGQDILGERPKYSLAEATTRETQA
jgi:phosphate transport system regulatory protein PhoU